MKKFGVLGFPVKHSLSPKMYNAAFKFLNAEAFYEFCEVELGDLNCFMKRVKTGEYAGLSVTVPYKEKVIEYCDEVSDDAKKIGAVNCLYFKDGKLIGENTDWIGFREALCEVENDFTGKKVLVCGAGGAARACLYSLNRLGVTPYVTNRTYSKVLELGDEFDLIPIEGRLLEDSLFDIIINATALGLELDDNLVVDESVLKKSKLVFDLIYLDTPLVKLAKKLAIPTVDAKKMLLYQAAVQFKFFTGANAPIEVMWSSIIKS